MRVALQMRPGFFVGLSLTLVAALNACANDVGADEDEPFDDRSNEAQQGLYDCTESSATGYRNGNSFGIKVVHVDGKAVQVDTANAYVALQKKAKNAGVNLRIVSGFRTMAEQQYLYNCYIHGNCNGGNLAAHPGYSNHQSGHALDLNTSDPGVYSFLTHHADELGFARTVPSEIWHWEWWGDHSDFHGPCGLPPIPPKCASGHFHGNYCDDDGKSDEQSHDTLNDELGVNFHCSDINGHAAYCGSKDASRANSIFVLGKAAKMPTAGFPNAFVDDNGNAREKYLNAAKHYGIMDGYSGRKVKPNNVATRNTLASILARMYKLPAADHDYFFDDDGDANEATHNKVAAAGLFTGYADAHHTRRKFEGSGKATRDTLAMLAIRAHAKGYVPVWDIPQPCLSGHYDGAFCDDDGRSDEAAIDRLVGELATPLSCRDLAGRPAFCPTREASRADVAYVLGKAAQMPVNGWPNGFRDDDGHRREKYLNAAKHFGIYGGYNGGRDVKPDKIASRDTVAIVLSRLYALPDPPAGTPDPFTDDDGSANEKWHNRVAYAGLFSGYADGHGGRAFKGGVSATRSMLATLASRAKDAALVPVWALPGIAPAPAPNADPSATGDDAASVTGDDDPASDDDAPGFADDGLPADPDDLGDEDPLPGEGGPGLEGEETDPGFDLEEDGALEAMPDGLRTSPRAEGGCAAIAASDGASLAAAALLSWAAAALLLRPHRRRFARTVRGRPTDKVE